MSAGQFAGPDSYEKFSRFGVDDAVQSGVKQNSIFSNKELLFVSTQTVPRNRALYIISKDSMCPSHQVAQRKQMVLTCAEQLAMLMLTGFVLTSLVLTVLELEILSTMNQSLSC